MEGERREIRGLSEQEFVAAWQELGKALKENDFEVEEVAVTFKPKAGGVQKTVVVQGLALERLFLLADASDPCP